MLNSAKHEINPANANNCLTFISRIMIDFDDFNLNVTLILAILISKFHAQLS